MKQHSQTAPYRFYLVFMLLACTGALIWQLWLPQLAEFYSIWGTAAGWQREIALWNVGLIASILYALAKHDVRWMKALTFQSTVLCWALGTNHLFAFISSFSSGKWIHMLGVLEVMLLGGIWGTVVLVRYKNIR